MTNLTKRDLVFRIPAPKNAISEGLVRVEKAETKKTRKRDVEVLLVAQKS